MEKKEELRYIQTTTDNVGQIFRTKVELYHFLTTTGNFTISMTVAVTAFMMAYLCPS
jgi:hypothetical protein